MRRILLSTAMALCAGPALAERIETDAPVREVTLYPAGASITRIVELDAPAGIHEVILPGFGEYSDPSALRVAGEGVTIGTVSLQMGRATPADTTRSAPYNEAKAEVQRLEAVLRDRDARVAAIHARGQAAESSIAFLMTLAGADNFPGSDLTQIMQVVNAEMLRARETAIAAENEAAAAEEGREDDVEALELARSRLEALTPPQPGSKALVLAVEKGAEPARIRITDFNPQAGWRPVYDLRLDQQTETLTLDRGFVIAQNSGADWKGVTLTLSTARPSEQSAPTVLTPWFPRLFTQDKLRKGELEVSDGGRMGMIYDGPAPEADMAVNVEPVVVESAAARMMGATVVYDYPAPVDIRTGVDALRLRLDSRELKPEIRASVVPQRDSSAYLVADTVNTLNEVILPGQATLYTDGTMVGRRDVDLIPAGEEFRLGFGPIDGLIAEFEVPEHAEGDRGLLSKSNTNSQKVVMRVRNVTDREWPLRVVSQVPVSTQDDLKISWSADPRPTAEGPEGQRGLLYWDSTIAPQDLQVITLSTSMSWPEGKQLDGADAPGARPVPIRQIIR